MRRTLVALAMLMMLVMLGGCSASRSPNAAGTPDTSSAQPTPPVSTRRADCVASTEEVTVRPNEPPGAICVVVGATLRVTSAPPPSHAWQLLSTSDSGIVACSSTTGPGGTVEATCRALTAGRVTLSTNTELQTARPNGPPDYAWRTTVVVVA